MFQVPYSSVFVRPRVQPVVEDQWRQLCGFKMFWGVFILHAEPRLRRGPSLCHEHLSLAGKQSQLSKRPQPLHMSSLGAVSGWPFLWEITDAPLRDEHSGNLNSWDLWTLNGSFVFWREQVCRLWDCISRTPQKAKTKWSHPFLQGCTFAILVTWRKSIFLRLLWPSAPLDVALAV